jgi:catechol 1,2-dioxygenase
LIAQEYVCGIPPKETTMRRFILTAFVLALLAANTAVAQQTAADFVGTWELVSVETRSEDGSWIQGTTALSGTPVGILMYDNKGNMAVQITATPRSTENPPDSPSIVNGYSAYYGKYEVDAEDGTVTHHRQNHINPTLGHLSVVRFFLFHGDTLTLTVAPERNLRLDWVRVR